MGAGGIVMKSGDRVWIPGTIHAEVAGRTQPIYEVDALGDVPADRVLPDSAALPVVARWLADPGNRERLTVWLGYMEAIVGRDPGPEIDALRALLAPLDALEGS
jgi:hypothetical protein